MCQLKNVIFFEKCVISFQFPLLTRYCKKIGLKRSEITI